MPDPKKIETAVPKKILAQVLHDLAPNVTSAQWEEHIERTKDDPKAFFGGNGVGYEEYLAFTSTYDADKRERALKAIRRQ